MNVVRLCILLGLVACASPKVAAPASCVGCHGSETSIAPPTALGGLTGTGRRGVGAHQVHLTGQRLGNPVPCEACHVVPAAIDSPGHIDDPWPADLTWGGLANARGAETTWNTETLSCSGSYCHGATLAGGRHTEPVWTEVNGTQVGCGSCHGFPPPAPHPEGGACGDCHSATVTGATITTPENHLDGVVQIDGVGPAGCDGCHGADGDPAPPPDLAGNTATTARGVGAHQAHLQGGAIGSALACAACHPVPAAVNDGPHLDGVVDVVFGPLASADGVAAAWDPATATCTVYCHGASLQGAPPVWTQVDGSQIACGSCHGSPPPPPHPGNSVCSGCHGTAGPGPVIADPVAHIDGSVDF